MNIPISVSKTIEDRLRKNESFYVELCRTVTSVPELLLTATLQSSKWTKWDWLGLILTMCCNHYFNDPLSSINGQTGQKDPNCLITSIIEELRTQSTLDKVLTDKDIVIALCYAACKGKSYYFYSNTIPKVILAEVFKKFPDLWNISWMWSTPYRYKSRKISKHVHRLRALAGPTAADEYTSSHKFYEDFIKDNSIENLSEEQMI